MDRVLAQSLRAESGPGEVLEQRKLWKSLVL